LDARSTEMDVERYTDLDEEGREERAALRGCGLVEGGERAEGAQNTSLRTVSGRLERQFLSDYLVPLAGYSVLGSCGGRSRGF